MSKSAKKAADQAEREKVHKRYSNRREPDVIYPARKQVDFYDADVHQRVAVYVRVSTDNLGQETSYELQKNYYEEFVLEASQLVACEDLRRQRYLRHFDKTPRCAEPNAR